MMRTFAGLMILGILTCMARGADQSLPALTDADLNAGKTPNVGDTVILSDLARCFPRSAISPTNTKGRWWLRPYRTAGGRTGKMLSVEMRDKDKPETCLAGTLTYPLTLSGTYDLWIGTYRPKYGGGIDIRLSRDRVFGTIDPWECRIDARPPKPESFGRLVENLLEDGRPDRTEPPHSPAARHLSEPLVGIVQYPHRLHQTDPPRSRRDSPGRSGADGRTPQGHHHRS